MWYKIELNRDQSIKSCSEVDRSLVNGVTVLYIEASSKEEALRIVRERYDRKLKYDRERKRAKRAACAEEGVCSYCKNELEPDRLGKTRCLACKERLSGNRLGVRWAKTDKDKISRLKVERAAGRRNDRKRAGNWLRCRRSVLEEVHAALNTMTPSAFRFWLNSKLEEAREKECASQEKRSKAA